MLTPKQIKIFEIFMKKPYKEFTYTEIKAYHKEKSNSTTQKAIIKFLSEELIIKHKIGNIILYSLNFNNNIVYSYFEIIAKEKLHPLVKNSLKIIKQELSNTEFISIMIFGSYAEGKQKEKSDLDIAIFVKNTEDKRKCERAMKSAELKSIIQLDIHVITKNEMLAMLKDNHENLGKQIAYKHLIVQNPLIFYSILQEGINNGFKIIYT